MKEEIWAPVESCVGYQCVSIEDSSIISILFMAETAGTFSTRVNMIY